MMLVLAPPETPSARNNAVLVVVAAVLEVTFNRKFRRYLDARRVFVCGRAVFRARDLRRALRPDLPGHRAGEHRDPPLHFRRRLGLASLNLAAGADGTRFEIIPGDTLATFFGTTTPTNTLAVQGAATPAEADIIQVWGGAAWLNFYYNTTWQRWARDIDVLSDPSRNNFVLRADRGVMITRRGSTPLDLLVIGRVLNTPQRAVHTRTDNALTFLATMQASDITLGALALQSSTRSVNWQGAADPASADILLIWSGATWFSFYYNTAFSQWRRAGDSANRDTFLISAGTPVFVQRRGSGVSADDKTIVFPTPGS